ncbi:MULTISPECIES: carbohydrate ABC transporter permease [Bacillota]|jgi:N-acetylglucosamine transport system permease protein|uniref:Carbohydrate ABC transporter permease n=2 Tax=Amedibacillus TaxID=2749846 RepID=A0A7G9GJB1_9FIRM|nr:MULTISPECIES: carbohydrate ABC transporter permease [Bacillota]QNM10893.1 carbohydrate ABC transporter permease [[Eubacterium] hominis]MCH4285327.1 carbohydrate ABC transporter permease [Amedibacillus hominis]RGB58387.1 carbohydrate ABC transporter permease [Absiella sp. AM22-9]RGB67104.1 carbohydrate ABC transporter permease [Absiella sp. AM09-45]RGB76746.1 carbohydrate ABC transporter permease [Absiella sp. AM09-50]
MKKKEKMSSHAWYKIFVYFAMIVFAITIVVPIAWVFLASLKSQLELVGDPWTLPEVLLWSNYATAFTKAHMGDYLINSVMVTAMALVILLIVALPASYVLARFNFKGKKAANMLFMAGLFVNVNYIVLPIYLMLFNVDKALGLTNFLLNNKLVLAIVYASTSLPFTIYLLSGFFKTLPKAYEEAALIDGCGYFKTMTKIMIPMARPSIITVILFQFLSFWNEYIVAFTLMEKENSTLAVGLKFLMASQRSQADFGVMYAGLVIVMVPTLILYILVQKKLTQGMSLGGLKD